MAGRKSAPVIIEKGEGCEGRQSLPDQLIYLVPSDTDLVRTERNWNRYVMISEIICCDSSGAAAHNAAPAGSSLSAHD